MSDVGKHSNITLYTMSELEEVSGYIGNFSTTISTEEESKTLHHGVVIGSKDFVRSQH